MQILDSLVDGPLLLGNRREGDELIGMIVRYLRTGEAPEPRTDSQRAILAAVRPVMETSRSRIVAGSNGGSKQPSNDASKQPSKTTSKQPSKPESKTESKAASKRPSEEEEEEEEEVGITEKGKGKRARFRAPSPADVREYAAAYAESKGIALGSIDFDPDHFVDYYESKGWKVGKAPMKDWKATVRNWLRSSKPRGKEVSGDDYSVYD